MSANKKSVFADQFTFDDWAFDIQTGQLKMNYHDSQYGDFSEVFVFSDVEVERFQQHASVITAAIDCLYWMAGVSYYKTGLARNIVFNSTRPSLEQAHWLTQTWQAGLAELAFEAGLGWLDHINLEGQAKPKTAEGLTLRSRSLVAIGGGKDSLVSIEAIKAMNESATLFMVGQSAFIRSVAAITELPLLAIQRQVDPNLKTANDQGAFNGHVPITAINACVAVVAALLYDYDSVVFSNERSADVGNVKTDAGQWVNHQYSKSLAYEQLWQDIVRDYIATDLDCFSLLRPFSELAIVERFAKLKTYFPYFSSCNRNFHLTGSKNTAHHWCGECPKCAFVFMCLAPFVSQQELLDIFQKNLFEDEQLSSLFDSLLGIQGLKPFECVGEQHECRLAVSLLADHPEWCDHPQVRKWLNTLPEIQSSEKALIMSASCEHQIPSKRNFRQVLGYET